MSGSSQYTIICYPEGSNAYKSIIAGKFGGVSINYPQNFNFGVDNKTPEFLKKNPLGQVPLLESPDGNIFESNAIARYIARVGTASTQLLGKNAYEQSIIDQWIEFNTDFFQRTYAMWSFLDGWGTYVKEEYEKTKSSVSRAFQVLETVLSSNARKYLVNDTVTLADIIIACCLWEPLKFVLDKEFRAAYPKTEAYLASLYALPEFKDVIGNVTFVEKYTPPN